MDAILMYTNIDTNHALAVIGDYLRKNPVTNVNAEALINGLTLLMKHNVFCFGDTYLRQQSSRLAQLPS
jgi:hypothetical protein